MKRLNYILYDNLSKIFNIIKENQLCKVEKQICDLEQKIKNFKIEADIICINSKNTNGVIKTESNFEINEDSIKKWEKDVNIILGNYIYTNDTSNIKSNVQKLIDLVNNLSNK